jgi:uncharacterized protein YjbI with pentapeptide repeats
VIFARPSRTIVPAAEMTRGSSPSDKTIRWGRVRARAFSFSTSVIARPSYHRFAWRGYWEGFGRIGAASRDACSPPVFLYNGRSHRFILGDAIRLAGLNSRHAGGSRKAVIIRHKGKKLSDILDAHAKFHKGQPGGERADLSGADLSGQDLRKSDLTGANLVGCRLKKADLRGSKLSFADLSQADLRKADLRNCDFTETKLEGADLSEADLSGTELFRGDLTSAKLHKTILRGTVLRQAILRGADFSGSDLALASFREIDLTDVKMDGVDLKDAVVRDNTSKPAIP